MSYEANWGYRESTDEFGVHIASNDYGCEIKTVEGNEFIVEIELCSDIKDLIVCHDTKLLSDQFAMLRIISDFEPISAQMISQFIMDNHTGVLAYPLSGKDVLTFTIPNLSNDKSRDNCIKNTYSILRETYGLEVISTDSEFCTEADSNSSCFDDKDMVSNNESESDVLIKCLLNTIYYHMIISNDWFAFAIDDQKNGVFARESSDGASFVDVIILKGCTLNAHGGRLMLRFGTLCCRIIKPELKDLVNCEMRKQSAHENSSTACGGRMVSTMIYLPTGEEVTVATYNSYRGYLTSDLINSSISDLNQKKKKNLDNKANSTSTNLLTELDIKNRLRGYSLFLPDSKEKCDNYWRMAYGIELLNDTDDDNERKYHMTEITMELGDNRIIPTQLLASSIANISSRTRRLAYSTAKAFTSCLGNLSIIRAISDPLRLQPGGTSSSLQSGNINIGNSTNDDNLKSSLSDRLQSALKQREGQDIKSGKSLFKTPDTNLCAHKANMQLKEPFTSHLISTNSKRKMEPLEQMNQTNQYKPPTHVTPLEIKKKKFVMSKSQGVLGASEVKNKGEESVVQNISNFPTKVTNNAPLLKGPAESKLQKSKSILLAKSTKKEVPIPQIKVPVGNTKVTPVTIEKMKVPSQKGADAVQLIKGDLNTESKTKIVDDVDLKKAKAGLESDDESVSLGSLSDQEEDDDDFLHSKSKI